MSISAFEAINARIRALRIEQEQISASYDAQIRGLAESLDILDRHLQSAAPAATATDPPFASAPTPLPKKRRGRRTKAEMEAAAAAKADGANKPPAEDYADI